MIENRTYKVYPCVCGNVKHISQVIINEEDNTIDAKLPIEGYLEANDYLDAFYFYFREGKIFSGISEFIAYITYIPYRIVCIPYFIYKIFKDGYIPVDIETLFNNRSQRKQFIKYCKCIYQFEPTQLDDEEENALLTYINGFGLKTVKIHRKWLGFKNIIKLILTGHVKTYIEFNDNIKNYIKGMNE